MFIILPAVPFKLIFATLLDVVPALGRGFSPARGSGVIGLGRMVEAIGNWWFNR